MQNRPTHTIRRVTLGAASLVTAISIGCQNNTETDALVGTGVGAGVGAIAGGWEGAAIGAGIGALGGALVGTQQDKNELEKQRLQQEQQGIYEPNLQQGQTP
ncbi:MAG: YMGG-like glycine zipper-containing protein [Planctomycetota bacterium]|nr:YMGG-like glycine zipper-containing protein [Planctomycetota bacterium]MDA1106114.1 YMGG-like glycine zipper-containing protein [Planctomycetota bacterium]